jgi:CheY-like chemotaxis protein
MSARPRLLCVDDEPELLNSLKLVLRKHYDVTTAPSGQAALDLFAKGAGPGGEGPFDVVVSDMRMPGMSGAEFLSALRELHPEVPRLLLSGQSDLDAAIAAINDAKVFRFLTKPCTVDQLVEAVDDALEQARLRRAEAELLDGTLNGAVGLLSEVLGLVSAAAYSRTMRVDDLVTGLCAGLKWAVPWDLRLATKLCQIGFVVIPDAARHAPGSELDPRHPEVASQLLSRIPRLESVSEIVRRQLDSFPASRAVAREEWTADELHVEILRVAVQYDILVAGGLSRVDAIAAFAAVADPPPAFMIEALRTVRAPSEAMLAYDAAVADLIPGMLLVVDVETTDGAKLASAGMRLNSALIERIKAFDDSRGIVAPIAVMAPSGWVIQARKAAAAPDEGSVLIGG